MLIDRKAAKSVGDEVRSGQGYNGRIATDFYNMMNEYHMLNLYDDYQIEKILLRQQELDVEGIKNREPRRTDIVLFNPSSAGKCPKDLYYRSTGTPEDGIPLFSYNKRWAENGTAVHGRIQRDLLYASVYLPDNPFTVALAGELLGPNCKPNRRNLPAWENNVLYTKEFTHNGYTFAIRGMCDCYLWYGDKLINLEIKTKSTTIAAVGSYKMKEPMPSHVMQCICYSLLFMGNPYEDRTDVSVIFYESLAKDEWSKGEDARTDIRTFQVNVTKEDRVALLDKFADVVMHKELGLPPESDTNSCIFCKYKGVCKEGNVCES